MNYYPCISNCSIIGCSSVDNTKIYCVGCQPGGYLYNNNCIDTCPNNTLPNNNIMGAYCQDYKPNNLNITTTIYYNITKYVTSTYTLNNIPTYTTNMEIGGKSSNNIFDIKMIVIIILSSLLFITGIYSILNICGYINRKKDKKRLNKIKKEKEDIEFKNKFYEMQNIILNKE